MNTNQDRFAYRTWFNKQSKQDQMLPFKEVLVLYKSFKQEKS